jgi:hypothetical protein
VGFLDGHGGQAGYYRGGLMGGYPDVDSMSYEELLELGERMGEVKQRGLKTEDLSVLPTYRWKEGGRRRTDEMDEKKGKGGSEEVEDSQCSICLTPYEQGEEIKRLQCFHTFHSECLDRWSVVSHTQPSNGAVLVACD